MANENMTSTFSFTTPEWMTSFNDALFAVSTRETD